MELTYSTDGGRVQIKQELSKAKDAFQFLSIMQEMFDEEACGCCHSTRTRCEVREVDDFKYYQRTCQECHARLEFGQHKNEKTLFAKRWDTERKAPLPDNGWFVWKPEQDEQPARGYGSNQRTDQRPPANQQRAAAPKESADNDTVPW